MSRTHPSCVSSNPTEFRRFSLIAVILHFLTIACFPPSLPQRHGHRSARTDPTTQTRLPVAALDPARYGFSLDSRKLPFDFSPTLPLQLADTSEKYDVRGILDFGGKRPDSMKTMQEISDRLSESYTAGIGFEASGASTRI